MPLRGDDPAHAVGAAGEIARALGARHLLSRPSREAGEAPPGDATGTAAPAATGAQAAHGAHDAHGAHGASARGAHQAHTSDERSCRGSLAELASSGLLGHVVPAPFGGHLPSVSVRALVRIREELAFASGLLDLMFVMQGLGSFPITLGGDEAQKQRFLPDIAAGRKVAAFAVTEPDAGSDVAAMTTSARLEGDAYVLDGVKTFISNAPFADIITVIARTAPAGTSPRSSLSAFVVEGSATGLAREEMEMIVPHPIGTLRFTGCKVPLQNRLGEEGEGFRIAMGTLDTFRPTVGAAAVGFARRALEESVQYAKSRVQFGRPIAEFEGIQFKLADMATTLEAARLLVERAAVSADRASDGQAGSSLSPLRDDPSREASMAKLFATEMAQQVVDEAVQIFGGRGLVRGHIVESLYREVRALRIYEGTSEIQRSLIARSLLRP